MLSKEGDVYAGTLDGRWGKTDLENVKVSGDAVAFAVTNENDRGSFTSAYKAQIDEDTLKGTSTVEFGQGQFTRSFSATRKLPKAEPVGVWKWETRGFRRGGQESDPRENALTLAMEDGVRSLDIRHSSFTMGLAGNNSLQPANRRRWIFCRASDKRHPAG